MKRWKRWIAVSLVAVLSVMVSGEAFAEEMVTDADAAVTDEIENEDPGAYRLGQCQISSADSLDISVEAEALESSSVIVTHNSKYANCTIEKGVDVSKWNGTIDWAKVAKDDIKFAFVRVGYRGSSTGTLYSDTSALTNLKGAKAAGIKVGVYFYSQAITEAEAKAEADYAIDIVKQSGISLDLPVVMDQEFAETDGSLSGRLYNASLSKTQATNVVVAFCKEVTAKGYSPMLYANKANLTSYLNVSSVESVGKIWLANPVTSANNATSYTGNYEYWQYYWKGSVSGISTATDMNYHYITSGTSSTSTATETVTGTASVNVSSLNVRTGPATTYASYGTIAKGTKVSILGTSGSWTKVKTTINGTSVTGYVLTVYITEDTSGASSSSSAASSSTTTASGTTLSATASTTATTKTGKVNASSVNVRSGAGTSYTSYGTVSKGTAVKILGTSGSWTKVTVTVKNASKTGYILSTYITEDKTTANTTTSSTATSTKTTASTTTTKTGKVNASSVNVRSGAGTSYTSYGTVSKGTAVKILGTSGSWTKVTVTVKNASKTGYILSTYITEDKTTTTTASTTTTKTGKVNASFVNVRSGAGTSYTSYGTVSKGTAVKILGTSGSWTKVTVTVKNASKTGYILSTYITVS